MPSSNETRRVTIGAATLEIVVGSLVSETTDAMVNPAQKSLFPGGGDVRAKKGAKRLMPFPARWICFCWASCNDG